MKQDRTPAEAYAHAIERSRATGEKREVWHTPGEIKCVFLVRNGFITMGLWSKQVEMQPGHREVLLAEIGVPFQVTVEDTSRTEDKTFWVGKVYVWRDPWGSH